MVTGDSAATEATEATEAAANTACPVAEGRTVPEAAGLVVRAQLAAAQVGQKDFRFAPSPTVLLATGPTATRTSSQMVVESFFA